MYQNRRIAHIVFITGLFLLFLGTIFLLCTMGGVFRLSPLWSLLCVIIGAFSVVLAIKLNKRSLYLFFALFFLLVEIFLFLSALAIIPVTLAQGWPLLSVFAGLALLFTGWRHYRAFRYRYLIPALAFIGLGSFFLLFSFKIVSFSFKRFIINWWPLLIGVAGIILYILSLKSRSRNEDEIS